MFAGADGGYWISPLSGYPTFPPPVIAGFGPPETYQKLFNQVQQVMKLANDPAALADYLDSIGIHYIYSGIKGGILSPQLLESSPRYQLIFNDNGARVFKLTPGKGER